MALDADPRALPSAAGTGTSARGTEAAKATSSGAGYAQGAPPAAATSRRGAAAKKSTAKKSGPLAFLSDRKLSTEEKLMRLLVYLNGKWQKQIDAKMKEMGGAPAASSGASRVSSSGTSGRTKSGLLGSVVKAATTFFPQVGIGLDCSGAPPRAPLLSKIGGPVLAAGATALGFPALAPALLAYGPALVDAAAGVATTLDGREPPAPRGSRPAQRRRRRSASGSSGGAAASGTTSPEMRRSSSSWSSSA